MAAILLGLAGMHVGYSRTNAVGNRLVKGRSTSLMLVPCVAQGCNCSKAFLPLHSLEFYVLISNFHQLQCCKMCVCVHVYMRQACMFVCACVCVYAFTYVGAYMCGTVDMLFGCGHQRWVLVFSYIHTHLSFAA